MKFTDFRLKVIHFFRKNKRIIFFIVIIWLVIFLFNQLLKIYRPSTPIDNSYEPHISVMNPSEKVPEEMQTPIEDLIKEYVEHCNNNEFEEAYSMLSKDCRKYAFNYNVEDFRKYVMTKMPVPKLYDIQSYSILDNKYIYLVRYTDDFLATGLTNEEYSYTEEKMVFTQLEDGTVEMSVGDFYGVEDIKTVAENEYIKIDIQKRILKYDTEEYIVKLTNRTKNVIVLADGLSEDEINLQLPKEYRNIELEEPIILYGSESKEFTLSFPKYVDDGDSSVSIIFNNIRVLNDYYGSNATQEEIDNAVLNAIAKFSMQLSVNI